MTMTLDRGTEFLESLDHSREGEKVCTWTHVAPVKADFEALCLGCGAFSGYACVEHEKHLVKIMNSRGVDGKLMCAKCRKTNRISFIPMS